MATPIKQLLSNLVDPEHAWKVTLLKNWEQIIGSMKNKVTLETIFDTHLLIGVTHPAWAHELSLLAPIITQKINAVLKEDRIKKLTFRVVNKTTSAANHTLNQDNNDNRLKNQTSRSYSLTIQEYQALETVQDAELRASLELFFIRCSDLKRR